MDYGRSLHELSRLDDRVALIIGGAGHIGRVSADGLAERGASIVIVDISAERSQAVADELKARHGVKTLAIQANLENETEVKAVPQKVLDVFGRIDILVHLAAIVDPELGGWTCRFEDQSPAQWRRGLEINLTSALSKQNIRVDVPSRFTVGISTEPNVMNNAAERLLGLSQESISNLACRIDWKRGKQSQLSRAKGTVHINHSLDDYKKCCQL